MRLAEHGNAENPGGRRRHPNQLLQTQDDPSGAGPGPAQLLAEPPSLSRIESTRLFDNLFSCSVLALNIVFFTEH